MSTPALTRLSELPITKDQARTALVSIRLGLAAATWVAPRVTARLFGVDPVANPASPYLLRLFGTRDAWLAVEVLSAESPEALLASHVAIDVADTGAALMALGGGHLPKRAAVSAGVVAAVASVLGLIASQED